jgi:hypothetical protein
VITTLLFRRTTATASIPTMHLVVRGATIADEYDR